MQSDNPANAVPDRFLKRKKNEIPPGAGLEDKRLAFAVSGATGWPSWAVPASQKRRNVAIAFAQSDSSSPRSRVQASRESCQAPPSWDCKCAIRTIRAELTNLCRFAAFCVKGRAACGP
jgi:hypothetical protein